MTKPPGRPRGRPKTKESVTLRARVDVTLADRVKRYAAAHRQPLAVVMRDALLLLMDEYPSSADLAAPHRIAAHEFLSDRYDSSLDMLLGETDSAALEAFLSDTNAEVIETILAGANRRPEVVSDTTSGDTPRLSDRTAAQTESTPGPARMSDTNVPAFDTTKYVLGKLCPRGHDYHGTGHSLRHLRRHVCLACDAEQARARRQAQRKV
jgi:hypothetical protein